MHRNYKSVLTLCLVLSLVVINLPAIADDIATLKREYDAIEKQLQVYQLKVVELEKPGTSLLEYQAFAYKVVALEKQLRILDRRMVALYNRITESDTEITANNTTASDTVSTVQTTQPSDTNTAPIEEVSSRSVDSQTKVHQEGPSQEWDSAKQVVKKRWDKDYEEYIKMKEKHVERKTETHKVASSAGQCSPSSYGQDSQMVRNKESRMTELKQQMNSMLAQMRQLKQNAARLQEQAAPLERKLKHLTDKRDAALKKRAALIQEAQRLKATLGAGIVKEQQKLEAMSRQDSVLWKQAEAYRHEYNTTRENHYVPLSKQYLSHKQKYETLQKEGKAYEREYTALQQDIASLRASSNTYSNLDCSPTMTDGSSSVPDKNASDNSNGKDSYGVVNSRWDAQKRVGNGTIECKAPSIRAGKTFSFQTKKDSSGITYTGGGVTVKNDIRKFGETLCPFKTTSSNTNSRRR